MLLIFNVKNKSAYLCKILFSLSLHTVLKNISTGFEILM